MVRNEEVLKIKNTSQAVVHNTCCNFKNLNIWELEAEIHERNVRENFKTFSRSNSDRKSFSLSLARK